MYRKIIIKFKKKYLNRESGTVGLGYWYGFKERHAEKICSKRGHKYEVNRDS